MNAERLKALRQELEQKMNEIDQALGTDQVKNDWSGYQYATYNAMIVGMGLVRSGLHQFYMQAKGEPGAPADTRTCERCQHTWEPRGHRPIKICPRCKSPYWNVPRSIKAVDIK